MASEWKRGLVPPGANSLIHWRLVELADARPRLAAEPDWWSVLVELRDTNLARFLERLQAATDQALDNFLRVPPLYQDARHRDGQIVTLYVTRRFFELILGREDLGLGRVLLGRLVPALLRSPQARSMAPQPAPGPNAKAIIAVIDDGIAFAHELFRRDNGGSRVEYAWLQDGTPPNMPRGRELPRGEIDGLLAEHSDGGRLDEDGFYRAAGVIDFRNTLHKTAAFRRSHGTHVAALAAGMPPGTADDDFPLILVQLAADTVADTSGDRIEADLGAALQYVVNRAESIAAARGMGDELPLVINFSFGNYAGPHDGTDLIDILFAQLQSSTQRPMRLVLPAGNNNLARCHAALDFTDGSVSKALHWRLLPDDHTANYLEIWLPHRGANPPDLVTVEVATPDGTASAAVDAVAGAVQDLSWHGAVVARLFYNFVPFPTERGVVTVAVRPTASLVSRDLAPSGLWRIGVMAKHLDRKDTLHLRVQRNESLPGYPRRGRQSFLDEPSYRRFDAAGFSLVVDPPAPPCPVSRTGTLNAFASGERTVVLGGYVRADGSPAAYSAAGPTSPTRDAGSASREGPDALAPSDDSAVLGGVISAGSRCGSMVALGGSSAAAPQAARWLAGELAAGRPGDRHDIRQRAAADEQASSLPSPAPPERYGRARLTMPPQPGTPRSAVPARP